MLQQTYVKLSQVKVDELFQVLQLVFWIPNLWDKLAIYSLDTIQSLTEMWATRICQHVAIEQECYMDDWLSGPDSISKLVELCQQVYLH